MGVQIRNGTIGFFGRPAELVLDGITCEFGSNQQLESLTVGQVLTVRGRCSGRNQLESCTIKR